ncbi:DUF177 domain-containing protein [Micrococcales bacterium 31B]|nr:DUF177 domain-containing protein [Micrococcales bacterium 31B]
MSTRLDPRSPLVLDTHLLQRSPGSMREFNRVIQAPEGFGTEVLAVKPGANMILELRAESVMEGVYVSGRIKAIAYGECMRCLDPIEPHINKEFGELFAYPEKLEGEADDILLVEDDLINLEPVLRDAALLDLPFTPLCRPDCGGLCSECGIRLDDEPGHAHEMLDPRWAALQQLAQDVAEGAEGAADDDAEAAR